MIFPFDGAGNLSSNLIVDESHSVQSVNGVEHNFIIPNNAPFFDSSMVVVDADNGTILTLGTDYELCYDFTEANSETGLSLSGGLFFLDRNRTGNFKLRYQTLGGDFVDAATQALANGLDTANDLRVTLWSEVVTGSIPTSFPPTAHTQPVTDVQAVTDIISEMTRIADLLTQAPPYIKLDDVRDLRSTFVTPLISAINAVATSIQNTNNSTLTYETDKLDPSSGDIELTSLTTNRWYDTGVELEANVDGTYLLNYHCVPQFNVGSEVQYKTRFVVSTDGGSTYGETNNSYCNGIPEGLRDGWKVKVQLRVLASTPRIILASDGSDDGNNTSLTIARIGA